MRLANDRGDTEEQAVDESLGDGLPFVLDTCFVLRCTLLSALARQHAVGER